MTERPRIFDDLAGVAGGAVSALMGLKDEAEALARARIDEAIRRLDLVRREEFDAVRELAANARAGQEAAEVRVASLEMRVATLEALAMRVTALEALGARVAVLEDKARPPGGGGPGMIV